MSDKSVTPTKKPAYIVKYPHIKNKWWTEDEINAYADAAYEYYKTNFTEPYISTYFTENMLHKQTVARWREKNEYFNYIYGLLKQMQEERLAKWLISRDNSTAGLIFAMKNITSWEDQPVPDEDSDQDKVINNWPK